MRKECLYLMRKKFGDHIFSAIIVDYFLPARKKKKIYNNLIKYPFQNILLS